MHHCIEVGRIPENRFRAGSCDGRPPSLVLGLCECRTILVLGYDIFFVFDSSVIFNYWYFFEVWCIILRIGFIWTGRK